MTTEIGGEPPRERPATTYPGAAVPRAGIEVVAAGRRRISWGAIFGGVVVVLAIQLLLGMLGLGVGLSLVNPPQSGAAEAGNFGIGAAVWWGVSYFVALFAGGYVAARLAGPLISWDGALHGILIWAFTLLVTLYLLGTAVGGLVGGAFNAVGGVLSTAGQTIKSALPEAARATGLTPEQTRRAASDLLSAQPSGADPKSMSPEQAEQEIAAALPQLARGGDEAAPARNRITTIIAARLNISPDEANRRVDQVMGQMQQTSQQLSGTVKQAAGTAAKGMSRASFSAFAALVLGAICAAWGGHSGARRLDETPL